MMACRKPFQPGVTTSNANLLVVEGLINPTDSTFIKVSRTVLIAGSTGSKAETGASVAIESDASASYPLTEKSTGNFFAPPLSLDISKKYRIRITTRDKNVYLSDFVPVKVSPPIDSITWAAKKTGLQIYANTHDPSAGSRYYRWDFTEDWQFHAKYYSQYIVVGNDIQPRNQVTQNIYNCWTGTTTSSLVVVGSSAKLEKDVIFQQPVALIPANSEKISVKYSMLLRQFVLTKEAFDFWESLRKNTEQLGSIFDAQPSQLAGNIHNINDAGEIVIGYISAGTYQQKRIFVPRDRLPAEWETRYPYDCTLDSVYVKEPSTGRPTELIFFIEQKLLIPIIEFNKPHFPDLNGHLGATRQCGDCTIRGKNKPPSFWQ